MRKDTAYKGGPKIHLGAILDDAELPAIPQPLRGLLAKSRAPTTGRPSKMTPDRVRRLLFALRSAASLRACAEWSGIGWSTYRDWYRAGRKDDATPLLAAFSASCARAREEGELELVRIIELHAPRDWRAAQALLEAKKPKRYQRQLAAKVEHGGGISVKGLAEAFGEFMTDDTKGRDKP